MATDATTEMTPTELLHFYVGLRLQNGDRKVPVQQILADFPVYLRQREDMRGLIREAEDAIDQGRCEPLDLEEVIRKVVCELATEGIRQ